MRLRRYGPGETIWTKSPDLQHYSGQSGSMVSRTILRVHRSYFLLQTVADVIRTCLGPKAMLKMILDPMGGILYVVHLKGSCVVLIVL